MRESAQVVLSHLKLGIRGVVGSESIYEIDGLTPLSGKDLLILVSEVFHASQPNVIHLEQRLNCFPIIIIMVQIRKRGRIEIF